LFKYKKAGQHEVIKPKITPIKTTPTARKTQKPPAIQPKNQLTSRFQVGDIGDIMTPRNMVEAFKMEIFLIPENSNLSTYSTKPCNPLHSFHPNLPQPNDYSNPNNKAIGTNQKKKKIVKTPSNLK
jgi:hypothetical protein